jgi:hypothetical protein
VAAVPTASPLGPSLTFRTLADRPVATDGEDVLGFSDYADAFADLLDSEHTDTPLTLAISGPWGAGKTSVAMMLARRLEERPLLRGHRPHLVVWFNAWLHADSPHLGAAYAAAVARQVHAHRPAWRRLVAPLPAAMLTSQERWRRRLRVVVVSVIGALGIGMGLWSAGVGTDPLSALGSAVTWLELTDQEPISAGGGVVATLLALVATVRVVGSTGRTVADFVDDPRSEAATGTMPVVRQQIGELIAEATRRRRWSFRASSRPAQRKLVLFIDDLERCSPTQALEACDVVSKLFDHPDVVTVLIADMRRIAAAARLRHDLEPTGFDQHYLQKIVQLEFELPVPRSAAPMVVGPPDPGDIGPDAAVPGAPPTPVWELVGRAADASGAELDDRRWWALHRSPSRRRRDPAHHVAFAGPRSLLWIARHPVWASFAAFYIGGVVAMLLLELPVLARLDDDTIDAVLGAAGLASVAIVLIVWARTRRRLQLLDQALRSIDETLEAEAGPELRKKRDVTELATGAKWSPNALVPRAVIDQRVDQYLMDASPIRRDAEAEVLAFLPRLPRSAKRLLNQLRLHLLIAWARDVFADGTVDGRQFGRWIVLGERWPQLRSAIIDDPRLLGQLGEAAEGDGLGEAMQRAELDIPVSDDLRRFLTSGTSLQPCVDQLAHLT